MIFAGSGCCTDNSSKISAAVERTFPRPRRTGGCRFNLSKRISANCVGEFTLNSRPASCQISLSCRSEEHTSELQSPCNLVCRLLLEKKKIKYIDQSTTDKIQFAPKFSTYHYHATRSIRIVP